MRTLLVALAVVLVLPVAARADGSGDPLGYVPPSTAAPEVTRREPCQTATLTFTGRLAGTFSGAAANIANVFDSPTTHTLVLGANVYKVTIGPPPATNPHKTGAAGEP
jgi:hypothetical protein